MQKEFQLFHPRKYLLTMRIGEIRKEKLKDINHGSLQAVASSLKREHLGYWRTDTQTEKGYVLITREQ